MDHKSVEMVAMDFFSLSYFLHERKEPWYYRGTDDTFVNLPRLPEFLAELNREFNPIREVVLRGDCIYHRGVLFLQGGAGFLCSRAAARVISNVSRYLEMWTGYEDLTMGPFLDSVGIGTRNCCSPAFMGHGPNVINVRTPAKCPVRNLTRLPVPHHNEPLRNVIFFHKKDVSGKKLERALPRARLVFGAPERIRWVVKPDNFWPRTCLLDTNVSDTPDPSPSPSPPG
jgi:hypothetical protein